MMRVSSMDGEASIFFCGRQLYVRSFLGEMDMCTLMLLSLWIYCCSHKISSIIYVRSSQSCHHM